MVTTELVWLPTFPITRSFIGTKVVKLEPRVSPRAFSQRTVTADIFFLFPCTVGSPSSKARVCNWEVKPRPTTILLAGVARVKVPEGGMMKAGMICPSARPVQVCPARCSAPEIVVTSDQVLQSPG